MGEAQGLAAIDDMIRRLRGLPRAFEEAAPELASMAKRATDRAIAEGHSLDGKPWLPTKAGNKPLANAAKAVRAYVNGSFIIIELSGYEVFHNYGTHRVPARPILPSVDGMPLSLGIAIRKGIVKGWTAKMGGTPRA